MSSTARLVERIRDEYAAMPGLKLTREQVCRLWGVGHDTCTAALDVLLAEGFLHQTGTGKFIALPRPARMAVAAPTGDTRASPSIRCPHCGKLNAPDDVAPPAGHYDVPIRCAACHRVIGPTKRTA
jgi:hypothetical protein